MQVYLDNKKVYETPWLYGTGNPGDVCVPLKGASTLRLAPEVASAVKALHR